MKKTIILLLLFGYELQAQSGKLVQDVIAVNKYNIRNAAYTVYFPPGYDMAPSRKYPVVYFLSGAFDQNDWLVHGEVATLFDWMISERQTPAFVGVMLCGAAYNSSNWEALMREYLMRYPEKRVRSSGKRAIVGFSIGGYYAMRSALCMNDSVGQKLFSATLAFSPAMSNDEAPASRISAINNVSPRSAQIAAMLARISAINPRHQQNRIMIVSGDDDPSTSASWQFFSEHKETQRIEYRIVDGTLSWKVPILNLESGMKFIGDVLYANDL